MIKKTKKIFIDLKNEYKSLFLLISLVVCFYFSFCLFFDKPFNLDNDMELQYHTFYREWIRLV